MQGLAIIRWVEAAVYCIELHRARLEIRARFGRALRSVQRYRVGQEHNADHIAGELSRNGVEPVKRELGRFAKVCPMQSAAMTIGFPILACSSAAFFVGCEVAVLTNERKGGGAR